VKYLSYAQQQRLAEIDEEIERLVRQIDIKAHERRCLLSEAPDLDIPPEIERASISPRAYEALKAEAAKAIREKRIRYG
jgi:hypothetical protein